MLAQSHTACTIFDVSTVKHTLYFVLLYLMLAQSNTPYILLAYLMLHVLYLMLAQSHTLYFVSMYYI